jgi:OmpA-OmpF porin, OOP family
MKKRYFCMALLLSLSMATNCLAVERTGAFSVSPFVGGYTFDGVQHLETAPLYGLRLGYDLTDNWGIEGVGSYLATEGTRVKSSVNAVSYRLDVIYNFLPAGQLVPYLVIGGGGITAGHGSGFHAGGSNTDATFNGGGGLKYFLTDSVAVRGDARQLVVFDNKTLYNWEYTAGMTFLFGGEKPAPAAVVMAPPACNLAVEPPSIILGQSAILTWVSENAFTCSIQPSVGEVRPEGTMDVAPSADTFYTLSCTGKGGQASCEANIIVAAPPPVCNLRVTPAAIMKGDKATLFWTSQNAADCVLQPAIGAVKSEGSTEITPSADTAYTLACTGAGGKATSETSIRVTTPPPPAPIMEELCMALNIEYDTDKAVIKAAYFGEVEKVATFMKRFPQISGTIEGHTDNVASAKYNVKLSQSRAEGVVKMLVDKYGIDKTRLAAKGYGLTRPIADNITAAGRQKNRRTMANFGCVSVEK